MSEQGALGELAQFMSAFTAKAQHPGDRSMTRYRHDLNKMVENNEISTGPGRWTLGVPNAYGNAAYVPDPTIRMQRWGAAHDMSSTKTDVESDLLNLARPTTRSACGGFDPAQDIRYLTPMPETAFPQTHARLVDPPCTLRGSGWNRWSWLCENPQEGAMIPFEWGVDSRHAAKDAYLPAIAKPLATSPAAYSHAAVCGRVYMEPAVPVARPGGKSSTNVIGGGSGSAGTPRARYAPRGAAKSGPDHPAAPARAPAGYVEQERATTGVIAPPPPFTDFIVRN